MTIKCLIVDDEPIARDILVAYIGQVPYLQLEAVCGDAFEAMAILNRMDIDLIILDIDMPRLTGLDMLRSLKNYPAIIITSAYPEYALEGFELSVTDYLLKPFSFPRFVQATEKIATRIQQPALTHVPAEHDEFIMVKADKKLTKVFFREIDYVEAYGNYISIYRGTERIMSKQTLTQFEQELPPGKFARIHKSYVVSLKAVKYIEGNEVSLPTRKLPIGKVYKEGLMKGLQE